VSYASIKNNNKEYNDANNDINIRLNTLKIKEKKLNERLKKYNQNTISSLPSTNNNIISNYRPGNRVALIIGNSKYKNALKLINPKHDAKAISEKLKSLGFKVIVAYDVTKREFDKILRRFGNHLNDANVGLFFYAGHGLQVNGKNYLLPIDTKLSKERDLKWEAISLVDVINEMERKKQVNLIFLDACRDNPFSKTLALNSGRSRSITSRGLARVETPVGTMISYATRDGQTASDGDGFNSPYTQGLLKHINTPGLEISLMLRRVRKSVLEATNNEQVPWEYGSLIDEFYLSPFNK